MIILNPFLTSAFQDFFQNVNELYNLFQDQTENNELNSLDGKDKDMYDLIKKKVLDIYDEIQNKSWKDLLDLSKEQGGLFGYLDCSFLKSDLAMIYRTPCNDI